MARKNPVGKLAESTLKALKDPKGAAGKVVDQAKGTAALGRTVADTAGAIVGKAARRVSGREAAVTSDTEAVRGAATAPTASPGTANLRAVPDVDEPAETPPATSPKKQGDPLLETPETGESGAATPKRSITGKAPAAQAPSKKAPTKKAPTKKASAPKTAAKKAPAKKAPAKTASPADVADVVESAVAEDPSKTAATPAKKTPAAKKATKSAAGSPGDKLPAKKASAPKTAAKKAPAKKAPAAKSTAEKAPAKSTAKKAPAKKAQPTSAADLAAAEGEDVRTPAGTSAAAEGANPSTGDTSLTQPGTESVVDPATTKEVASEAATLRKAADNNPE